MRAAKLIHAKDELIASLGEEATDKQRKLS